MSDTLVDSGFIFNLDTLVDLGFMVNKDSFYAIGFLTGFDTLIPHGILEHQERNKVFNVHYSNKRIYRQNRLESMWIPVYIIFTQN